MKDLIRRRAFCLFATHFHMLLEDFRDVTPCYYMQYRKDTKNEHQINFLYKFVRGECPQSFGLNIAVMAGLPPRVIQVAKSMSDKFITNLRGIKKVDYIKKE